MRVLHVELGRHLYGGARQVAYLLDGLAQFPGEHSLACADGAEIAGGINNPAIRVHRLVMRGDLDLGFISRLRRLIRTEQPDLLHIHSRRGDFLSAVAGRLENVPMIYSRRVDNPPSWLDLRCKFPLFEKIITISEGIGQILRTAGLPPAQVVCVPSAVDAARYRPQCERQWFLAEFGLTHGQPVLAVIAQLIQRKGHQVLFDALPAILERHPDVHVLILGQGPLAQRLSHAASEGGLAKNIRFAGFRPDLERIIPCVDLVVHPAWMEGLGVSLLEAAACAVPIVASRVGGIPEVVRDGFNGYLIEPGDSKALATKVNTLLDHPEQRRHFGQAGRALVLERFCIERMVEGNHRLYQQLCASARLQRPR